jgi:hypothetical protein
MTKAECAEYLNEHWDNEEVFDYGPRRLLPLLYQLPHRRKTPLPLTKLAQEICEDFLYWALRAGWSDEEIVEELRRRPADWRDLDEWAKSDFATPRDFQLL